ncbi:Iron-uptake system permease protein FeuC [Raoultella planticola]|nr:Iron-uptake system permease protein FeuC [Raoultella planticola]
MKNAARRAGFRPLRAGSCHLLLRPAALNIAAVLIIAILLLASFGLTRGSFPLPAGTLARALFAPENVGDQPRFILFDIRLPRLLMALLCGAMLGLAGAAMQSITRNGLADPGLIGVKEGASVVVLALILFFPAVGLVWRPLAGILGGALVALLVLVLARDCSRPRFILIGIGVSWTLAAAVGIFMTTADVRDVQTAMIWLAGSLHAATWSLLMVAFLWALPGTLILFLTARAADVAQLGDRTAVGLGVRLQQLTLLRFFCAGAAHLCQRLLRRQPWLCRADGAAHGALSAARWPGVAAVRQRFDWRAAGAVYRYSRPSGLRAAANSGRNCYCAGGVSVFYLAAVASS